MHGVKAMPVLTTILFKLKMETGTDDNWFSRRNQRTLVLSLREIGTGKRAWQDGDGGLHSPENSSRKGAKACPERSRRNAKKNLGALSVFACAFHS